MPTPDVIREKQPPGHEGVKYSVAKMLELINAARLDPTVIAFGRRTLRNAGLMGQENQDPVKIARAIWDAIKKQGIGWVPDPVRSEFLAAPRHFIPSAEGKDDALFVAGDCDELSMLQASIFLAVVMSVGVEVSALCLHSYSSSKAIGHVLGAVHDGQGWIRVDHSGDWGFGEFKRPTHEILISLPSGRVACSAGSCERAAPLPALEGQWDHGRLEGLGALGAPGGGAGVLVGTLGDMAGDDAATLNAYASVLEGNRWSLLEAVESYTRARESLARTFELLNLSPEEQAFFWPAAFEARAQELLDGAVLAEAVLAEVQRGERPWAIDTDGSYAIGKTDADTERVSPTGAAVSVLAGLGEPAPPALGAPLPPAAIAALVGGGILLTLGGFAAIVLGLHELTEQAKIAEIRAGTETILRCQEGGGTPEECANLAKAIGGMRSSREAEEAKKAESDAKKTKSQVTGLAILAGLATAGAAVGGAFYLGLPQLAASAVSRWGQRKAA